MLRDRLNQCRLDLQQIKIQTAEGEALTNIAKSNNQLFKICDEYIFPMLDLALLACSLTESGYGFDGETYRSVLSISKDVKGEVDLSRGLRGYTLKTNANQQHNSLFAKWADIVKKNTADLSANLSILQQFWGRGTQKASQAAIVLQFIKKFQENPLDTSVRGSYFAIIESGEKLLGEMDFDPDVKEFLEKVVVTKTATFADLTPKIIEWIKKEDFAGKITLAIRNVSDW